MRTALLLLLFIACQCYNVTAQISATKSISDDRNLSSSTKIITSAPSQSLCIAIRAYLEGALMNNNAVVASDGRPLMRDDLRNSPFTGLNYIPASDPYEFAATYCNVADKYIRLAPQDIAHPQFQHVSDSAVVFSATGQDAIVDWVWVELRDKNNSATISSTRAGLIQRDGDIVELDGKSCLNFIGVRIDSYYVTVRHRSHLGAMTKFPQSPATLQDLVDFTVSRTPLYDKGTIGAFNFTGLAEKNNVREAYQALWAGDFSQDGKVKYDNPNDDLSAVLMAVVNHADNKNHSTSFDLAYGYIQSDYDMNSKVKYDSPNDDKSLLQSQVINYLLNSDHSTGFDLFMQQLP